MTKEQIKQEAKKVIEQLTPEDIAYAVDPDRGEYQGFAALHDLLDANTLLIHLFKGIDDLNLCNEVASEITRQLLAPRE